MKSLLVLLLATSLNIFAANNLDELLNQVKKDQIAQRADLQKREARFKAEKNQQAAMLLKAQKELKALEAQTKRLTSTFEANEKKLSVLEENLNTAMGTLGEMFGVVKQIAGDFRGQFTNSIITNHYPERLTFVSDLAERKALPTITELEKLWFEIQREMTESGKVVSFKSEVVKPTGEKAEAMVTRVGPFNLVSDGNYLNYQASTKQIVELPRQPQSKFLGWAADLEGSKNEIVPFGLDPSRGAILSLLVQAPSLWERLQYGGIVGYVILSLLFLGLVLVAERLFTLNKEGKKVRAQLERKEITEDNALGKLMKVYNENKNKDLETLEHKLDESILKSLPTFERGIPTIKILYAVAPLLGLLGTVTGMINTFQTITLFGTGDPKLMAGGISTALVTTVLGLVCAIPLLLLHNLVSSQSKSIIQILEEQSAGMMALRSEQEEA
jgi:biopolymer transport protein ExbB